MASLLPFVSVVIPNHNRAWLLEHAVKSALAQEGAQVEVLVCDDGSTDGSHDVVRAIDDPRVKWLPGPATGGPSAPRNRGIASANGDWIAFLDSDDTWLPGKLMVQLRAMQGANCEACSTNAFRWVASSDPSEVPPTTPEALPLLLRDLPARLDVRRLLSTNSVVTSAMIVRAEVIRQTGGFPDSSADIFEDYAVWLKVAHITPIVLVDAAYVVYRDVPEQSYRRTFTSGFTCARAAMRDFYDWRESLDGRRRSTSGERLTASRQLARLLVGPYLPVRRRRIRRDPGVPVAERPGQVP